MMEPELILFDEPSAGLDPVISSVIDELIISLTEKTNTTSVIVTHEMGSAFRIATRMTMLYQGKIIEAESGQIHDAERPDERERKRHTRDHRRPEFSQEEEHHHHDERNGQ